jgi:5-methylcytosine-specific restriction protein A
MSTYLFLWNPKKWSWSTIEQDINQVDLTGKCSQRWSCGNTKSIQQGDRIFLLKVGTEPKGIIAAGFATSAPFTEKHWSGDNKDALYIDVDFEVILNATNEPILPVEMLMTGNIAKQNWRPIGSGNLIKAEIVDELEAVWFNFLTTQKIRHNPFITNDNGIQKTYTEGTPSQVSITKYERNPYARKKCLEYYGYSCVVCDFNFENTFGQIGKSFIHVHHLNQIATIGNLYEIDPVKDLRPVCPNCHSIIHKQKIALSIEDIKELIQQNEHNK